MLVFLNRRFCLPDLLRDRGGNFAIITAIALPVLLGTVGIAMDLANMTQYKTQLQANADAAALAATSAMAAKGISEADARKMALDFLRSQAATGVPKDDDKTPKIAMTTPVVTIKSEVVNVTGKKYTVGINATYTVPLSGLTRVLGFQTANVTVASSSESLTETKNALSMFLVLDRSGSMSWDTNTKNTTVTSCTAYDEATWPRAHTATPCYIKKIEALKTAANNLFAQLTKADPKNELVRTGAVSYNLDAQAESPLEWGTTKTKSYVTALAADGGTNSGGAFKIAYEKLAGTAEDDLHKTKNGQVPTKYIVLMTDGANNYSSADTETKKWCDKARTDKMQVYSVAFMAPKAGQTLLKYCATSSASYFEADEMEDLVSAFQAIGEKATQQMTRLTN